METRCSRQARWLITPAQWIVGLAVVVVCGAIGFVLIDQAPRPDRIWDWSYTNASWASSATAAPNTGTLLLTSSDSLTNISRFYRARLGLNPAGAMFHVRHSGFFNRTKSAGAIPSSGDDGSACDTLLAARDGQWIAIHLSRPAGATNTLIRVAQAFAAPGRSGRAVTARDVRQLLAYPGAVTKTTSSASALVASGEETSVSMEAVSQYYEERCNGVAAAARKKIGRGTLVKLDLMPGVPLAPTFPTNHPVYFFSDPAGAAALISVRGKTNGTTEVSIAAGAF